MCQYILLHTNIYLITHYLKVQQAASGFPFGCADSSEVDGRRGSNVYEVSQWLWQFGS